MKRSQKFQRALAAGETITGLIIATTLVYPDKKINSVKAKSVKKRMKEKAFAAGVDRNIIMECEALGLNSMSLLKFPCVPCRELRMTWGYDSRNAIRKAIR